MEDTAKERDTEKEVGKEERLRAKAKEIATTVENQGIWLGTAQSPKEQEKEEKAKG